MKAKVLVMVMVIALLCGSVSGWLLSVVGWGGKG